MAVTLVMKGTFPKHAPITQRRRTSIVIRTTSWHMPIAFATSRTSTSKSARQSRRSRYTKKLLSCTAAISIRSFLTWRTRSGPTPSSLNRRGASIWQGRFGQKREISTVRFEWTQAFQSATPTSPNFNDPDVGFLRVARDPPAAASTVSDCWLNRRSPEQRTSALRPSGRTRKSGMLE